MVIPEDLTVDIRQQKIIFKSGGRVVEIEHSGRFGPFANGPVKLTDLIERYIRPALWQFENNKPALDSSPLRP